MAHASFSTIERHLELATAGISPENIAKELARYAIDEREKAIIAGEASSIYDTYVNGREGAAESTVVPPGPIVYVFSYWQPIIEFAMKFLREHSPVLSGRYQGSHQVMLGSQFIAPSTPISADETVTIVNVQPYSRKIEVGHTRFSKPDFIYERCSQAVRRQFGKAVSVKATQIMIPNGYILKGVFSRGHKRFSREKLRKDTQAGARMTYPAIEMRIK